MEEETGRTPHALEIRPKVGLFQEYMRAFVTLCKCRSCGFSANPISIQEIFFYLQLFPTDDVEKFVDIIKDLDIHYLQKMMSDQDKPKEKPDGPEKEVYRRSGNQH